MDAIVNGIELTGTLYTSAQGDAKDKLAMTDQIFDTAENKSQKEINASLKTSISGNNTALTQEIANIKSNYATNTSVENKVKAERDRIDAMLNGAPAAYDTLKEIADKLEANDDLHDAINASVNALQGLKVYLVTPISNNSDLIAQANADFSKILIFYKSAETKGLVYPLTVRYCNSSTVITSPFLYTSSNDETNKNGIISYVSITSSGSTINSFNIDGDCIVNNTIYNSKLKDKTITNAKIANGTIIAASIGANAVTSAKIMDGNVTEAKLSTEVQTKLNSVLEWVEL